MSRSVPIYVKTFLSYQNFSSPEVIQVLVENILATAVKFMLINRADCTVAYAQSQAMQ